MDNKGKNNSIFGLINSLSKGGAQRQMLYLFENSVISDLYLMENRINYSIKDDRKKNIKLLLSNKKLKSNILKFIIWPIYSLVLMGYIKTRNSQIISFEGANIINVFSKLFFKHKSIICVLSNPQINYKGIKSIVFQLIKITYLFSDIIVTNSKGVASFLKKNKKIKNKVFTIYNPISVEYIEEKGIEKLDGKEEILFKKYPVFINVGRLMGAKGQWNLLKVFKGIKNRIPESKLVIIGDGKLKNYLVDLSIKFGLKTFDFSKDIFDENYDVYFMGSKDNPFKYIKNSSIFVFSSFMEGFPNAILEAMACQIPVVSSDCRFGPREILAPNSDFLYETKEVEFGEYGVLLPVLDKNKNFNKEFSVYEKIWIDTIVGLYNDKGMQRNYSEKSLERIKEFDEKIISSEWKDLISNSKLLI